MFEIASLTETNGMLEALRDRMAALDPASLTPAQASELVAAGEQVARLGSWIKARFAAQAVSSNEWKDGRFRSPGEWLAAVHGTSKSQAVAELTLSDQLADLPAVDAAMARGELPLAAAKAIAEAAALAPQEEGRLVELGRTGTIGEVAKECERVKHSADPDPDARRARIRRARDCRVWYENGRGHLHLTGPADEIARIDSKVRHDAGLRYRTQRAAVGQGAAVEREPIEAHRYDAAIDLLGSEGAGVPAPKGSDAKIIVRIDYPALLRGYPLEGETCEIVGVGPVPVSVAREWFDDAFIAAVLTDGVDVTKVVQLGRKFTAHQVTALQARDTECVIKGCTNTWNLQLDHDTGWVVTHTTEVGDAQQLCPSCHRKKTLGWHLHPPDEQGKRRLVPPQDPTHPCNAFGKPWSTRAGTSPGSAATPVMRRELAGGRQVSGGGLVG